MKTGDICEMCGYVFQNDTRVYCKGTAKDGQTCQFPRLSADELLAMAKAAKPPVEK